ncbi:type IX secretion system outer membrane channel protein PorV [Deminuibacter soli]|uniref:Type IX secretion system protein PorV domain-containing protein n=1 Tax=Deminuibacter soli TaxID=2291815 RepID=A0A3E1NNP3_9BACT|nr:type IX secretion system outer membrane channel protein PorV [Deminuibacter soli]RFM29549.1 hypothetical protein DXN05_00755 [Deminuibacter soli]
MKRIKMNRCTLFILAGFVLSSAHAQKSAINATTTAVPFLKISPDARSGGMGDAGIGLSADANSVFYNGAKTVFAASKAGIAATYTPWMKDIADDMYMATLAGYKQLDEEQALTGSVRYFNLGNCNVINYNGDLLSTAHPREYAFDLGYARKISRVFSAGVALRYIHSKLATGSLNGSSYKAGTAVAADLSVFYNGVKENGGGWTAGFSLSNLGSKIGYTNDNTRKDFLPANLGIGTAYTDVWDDQNRFTIALDVNKSLVPKVPDATESMNAYYNKGVIDGVFNSFNNNAWSMGLGMEYAYDQRLFVRGGYSTQTYAAGNWQYVTTGLGLRYDIATINFSYFIPTGDKVNRNPLANTIRFGVLFQLYGK